MRGLSFRDAKRLAQSEEPVGLLDEVALRRRLVKEERLLRERELLEVQSALSSLPSRAGPSISVAAAAVGFLTSTAVMGDLSWFKHLPEGWQMLVGVLVTSQIVLVGVAIYCSIRTLPPPLISVYVDKGTESSGRNGFVADVEQEIRTGFGGGPVDESAVDAYMAMFAFANRETDAKQLYDHRNRLNVAAWCVIGSTVVAGFVLALAATGRMAMSSGQGSSEETRNDFVNRPVIISVRGKEADELIRISKEAVPNSGTTFRRRNARSLQRKDVLP